MSMTKREIEEEEQTQMLMRAITENNVKKIEEALEKTKKHGKGFVLSSQFAKPKPRQHSPKSNQRPAQPRMPIVIGSPIGSPPPSRKSSPTPTRKTPPSRAKSGSGKSRKSRKQEENSRPGSAYITEYIPKPGKVDMAVQSDDVDTLLPTAPPATPEQRSECGDRDAGVGQSQEVQEQSASRPDSMKADGRSDDYQLEVNSSMMREEPIGKDSTPKVAKKKSRENRISKPKFDRLGLPKRPEQYKVQPSTEYLKPPQDLQNPEPLRPNVWITKVPKKGDDVKTPFYTQVDIPDGALRGDVIMKFETQPYNSTKLNLSDNDKLCSCVVDMNMSPLTYCLHKEATVRMRILEECINSHEDVTIVSARHFRWERIPTTIETREVNGDKHFYAVTSTQYLGKFAVITSLKMDRFVMTSAGGLFESTILPVVTLKVEEGAVKQLAHIVEMSVVKSRQEAVDATSKEANSVRDISGRLVASSPVVKVSKEIMGKTGTLPDGATLPANVHLTVPITTVAKSAVHSDSKRSIPWKKPTIKFMKRTQSQSSGREGRKSSVVPDIWEDITNEQSILLDPVSIQNGESVTLTAPIPSQVMVIVFDDNDQNASSGVSRDVSEVCDALISNNTLYNAALLIHQKTEKPEIISVHIVPEHAANLISTAMEKNGEWKPTDPTLPYKKIRVEEREHIDMNFRDGIRLTINQMEPQIQFNSRRWQGYQFQLEATDEAFSNCSEATIKGCIEFMQKTTENQEENQQIIHTSQISIPSERARPYHPTVVVREAPKVTVFREYKLKWMKAMSAAEQAKYKAINTP